LNETYIANSQYPGYIVNGGSYQNYTNEMQSSAIGSTLPANGDNNETGFRLVYISPVPEPSAMALAALAGVGLIGLAWRRRRSA
jgi:hypothetical protein